MPIFRLLFMGTLGGYFRLAVGILLSLEVMRLSVFGCQDSKLALGLALVFLGSTVVYVIRKTALE
jgi:hypothetical protein